MPAPYAARQHASRADVPYDACRCGMRPAGSGGRSGGDRFDRAADDAGGLAAGAECLDERAFRRYGIPPVSAQQVDRTLHRSCALDDEGLELTALDLLRDDELRNE